MTSADAAKPANLIQAWDARYKLVTLFALILVCATVQTVAAAAAGLMLATLVLLFSGASLRSMGARLGAVAIFLVPCFILLPLTAPGESVQILGMEFSLPGLQLALLLSLRALAVVAITLALMESTPIHRLLRAAERLRCPRILTQIALLTYRYIFSLRRELSRTRAALNTRAFENRPALASYRVWAQVIGLILLRSLERTERINHAMYCRGYSGRMVCLDEFAANQRDIWLTVGVALAPLSLVGLDWIILSAGVNA